LSVFLNKNLQPRVRWVVLVAIGIVCSVMLWLKTRPAWYFPKRLIGRELVVRWADRRFVSISTSEQARSLVSNFPVNLGAPLDEQRYQLLCTTIADLFLIYGTGNFNQFSRFADKRQGTLSPRIDVQRKYDVYRLPLGKMGIASKVGIAAEASSAQQMMELFRGWQWPPSSRSKLFEAMWLTRYHERPCWSGISTADANISIFEKASAVLFQPKDKEQWYQQSRDFADKVGSLSINYRTGFWDWPRSPGKTTFARVAFVAKHSYPDPPWPHLLWLRWEPSVSNWTLEAAAALYGGPERLTSSDLLF